MARGGDAKTIDDGVEVAQQTADDENNGLGANYIRWQDIEPLPPCVRKSILFLFNYQRTAHCGGSGS